MRPKCLPFAPKLDFYKSPSSSTLFKDFDQIMRITRTILCLTPLPPKQWQVNV